MDKIGIWGMIFFFFWKENSEGNPWKDFSYIVIHIVPVKPTLDKVYFG